MTFFDHNQASGPHAIRMMAPASVSTVIPPSVPIRVQTAMEFVALLDHCCRKGAAFDGGSNGWREKTLVEEGTYDAALGSLAAYFKGVADYREKTEVVEVVKGHRP